ncbi:MAG: hypothetical protein RIC35_09625 [Marinoscillum sp.]
MYNNTKALLMLFIGFLSHNSFAQAELHIGYSQPINEWAATDISKDSGYGKNGLVVQFGGPVSEGKVVRIIANMALGYNRSDSKRFGKAYANEIWRNDPAGTGDSLVSVQLGTYLFAATHLGLEIKIPLGGGGGHQSYSYIPLRMSAGPHMFLPPNKTTIKTYGADIDGNMADKKKEYLADWSYDILGVSYQIGTGLVLNEKVSLRVEYFGTLVQLGGEQFANNSGDISLRYPSNFQSLIFSVGILF